MTNDDVWGGFGSLVAPRDVGKRAGMDWIYGMIASSVALRAMEDRPLVVVLRWLWMVRARRTRKVAPLVVVKRTGIDWIDGMDASLGMGKLRGMMRDRSVPPP